MQYIKHIVGNFSIENQYDSTVTNIMTHETSYEQLHLQTALFNGAAGLAVKKHLIYETRLDRDYFGFQRYTIDTGIPVYSLK